MDDADAEAEGEEVADVVDITEEIDDGNGDGEGAIEEGERGLSKWSNQEPFESLLNPICAQVRIPKKLLRTEKIYEV